MNVFLVIVVLFEFDKWGSYQSAPVLINLLNELRKIYTIGGLVEHLIDFFFRKSFINSVIQGHDYSILYLSRGHKATLNVFFVFFAICLCIGDIVMTVITSRCLTCKTLD